MDSLGQYNVELFATLSKTEPWRLQRHYFPSKLGGFPSWLDPVHLPSESDLKCDTCSSILTFVLQVYAPDELCEDDMAFHRTVFLFVCQPCGNRWKAFRSQLPRKNDYYDFHPLEDNITIADSEITKRCCLACGLPSENVAKEPLPELTGMKIQLMEDEDHRELHERCKIAVIHKTLKATLEEWNLNICEGEIPVTEDYLSHEKLLYKRYLMEKKSNGDIMDESEEQAFESIQEENMVLDKSFKKFCKKTTQNEVLYYSREGEPLWLSDKTRRPVIAGLEKTMEPKNEDSREDESDNGHIVDEFEQIIIPLCENCGSVRSFEFQVLPQILHYLKSDRIDFGSISVYTCSKSCKIENKYQKEVVFMEKDYSLIPKKTTIN
ncbi:apoptosis regulatory protein [Theileria orientalis]|uniref:Apoptosis regulatory protein n=1 Tax=Theileria orientalis TaxID=68886 RepID=A0A976QSG3_THEOR|nr:apoptosis regulatory protein [Theileria orientalis]